VEEQPVPFGKHEGFEVYHKIDAALGWRASPKSQGPIRVRFTGFGYTFGSRIRFRRYLRDGASTR
jgi:hypothetical protein